MTANTTHTSSNRYGWCRAATGMVAGGALAVGLLVGAGAPSAFAVPSTKEPAAPVQPEMTAEEALAIVANDYDTGAGGGQLSQLIHEVLVLRSQGFRPSNANRADIVKALDKRPNQTPLVDALKSTITYQRKLQAQSNASVTGGGITAGINQAPPGVPVDPTNPGNTGVFLDPVGGIQQPLG